MNYDHKKIEKKWQQAWEADNPNRAEDDSSREKFYLLTEFPYPSGNLHVGHWYAFAVPDILARYLRMTGKNVLYPIGFDAFGLPAENAAIQRGLNPRDWTYDNMVHMRSQMHSMGASFDWSREVVTCDPKYYRWTQWQFLQFFRKGLAYRGMREVNWCPKDKTVLANEQVIDGHCERCGSEVVKKQMLQWNLRITNCADRLIDDLEALDWPKQIKDAQINWIGRSEGAEIEFRISNTEDQITVFTTRADTIFSGTFVILSPEHTLITQLKDRIRNWDEVAAYIEKSKRSTEIERTAESNKSGVELKGILARNPATDEELSVWVSDFVLGQYGTGAVFADAHDTRDFAMAKQYGIPLKVSIRPKDDELWARVQSLEECYTGEGMLVNSAQFNGLSSSEARKQIIEWLKEKGLARNTVKYKLRDWVVSRQRYWGVPIPIIHCKRCGEVVVPDDQLPLLLPEVDDYLPDDSGRSPLAKVRSFVDIPCPQCGSPAERETDTLDTFVDSSWYFLRYTDPNDESEFAAKEKQNLWMPIDLYSGGAEHTTMHLLYSRFWHKALFDLGLVGESEPYLRRMNRGLIMGPDGAKMSKRWGNVVDPDVEVKNVGADTVRMYLAFIGPYNETGAYPWNPGGIVGVRRFLERVWRLAERKDFVHSEAIEGRTKSHVESLLHATIKKVGEDIASLKMNTAVSALMIALSAFEKNGCSSDEFKIFVRLLAPFAPHITEELWHLLGEVHSVHAAPWPEFDPEKLVEGTVKIIIQINGKARGSVESAPDAPQATVEAAAREVMKDKLAASVITKVIYVPGRIINFVIAE